MDLRFLIFVDKLGKIILFFFPSFIAPDSVELLLIVVMDMMQ